MTVTVRTQSMYYQLHLCYIISSFINIQSLTRQCWRHKNIIRQVWQMITISPECCPRSPLRSYPHPCPASVAPWTFRRSIRHHPEWRWSGSRPGPPATPSLHQVDLESWRTGQSPMRTEDVVSHQYQTHFYHDLCPFCLNILHTTELIIICDLLTLRLWINAHNSPLVRVNIVEISSDSRRRDTDSDGVRREGVQCTSDETGLIQQISHPPGSCSLSSPSLIVTSCHEIIIN